jgi:hypothetical protein
LFSRKLRDGNHSVACVPLAILAGCTTANVDFSSVGGLPEEPVEWSSTDEFIEGAAVGASIGGLPGAVWADQNNDGYVDGYVYNDQYYAGTPPGYDATLRRVASGALGAVLGGVAGAVIPGVSTLEGAVIGAAVGGVAGAIWADRDNDGRVDGYVYNGQYYQGAPTGPTSVIPPSTGGTAYAASVS